MLTLLPRTASGPATGNRRGRRGRQHTAMIALNIAQKSHVHRQASHSLTVWEVDVAFSGSTGASRGLTPDDVCQAHDPCCGRNASDDIAETGSPLPAPTGSNDDRDRAVVSNQSSLVPSLCQTVKKGRKTVDATITGSMILPHSATILQGMRASFSLRTALV